MHVLTLRWLRRSDALLLPDEGAIKPCAFVPPLTGTEDNLLDAMNTRELAERLLEEGCNPSMYAIGPRGGASDAFYLSHRDAQWQVCYTERGLDSPPIYASGSESQACEFFYGGKHDPRYRVFVTGKEIFVAREALGVLPRRDTGA